MRMPLKPIKTGLEAVAAHEAVHGYIPYCFEGCSA